MAAKTDIFDEIVSTSESPRDIFDEIVVKKTSPEKKQPSKLRSAISAPLKGFLKTAQTINPFGSIGPISAQLGERILEEVLPSLPEHAILERAGKLAPYAAIGPEGLVAKGGQLAASTLTGELAKAAGLGETGQSIAEAAGFALPGLAKAGGKAVKSLVKPVEEKLPSGLTKPRAAEAKFPKAAYISKERQGAVIDKLNEQAAELGQKSVEKHVPIVKQIEKGVDFESKFQKDFENVQQMAEKANPEINITPISELISQVRKKYSGIPKLHPEGKKVVEEMKAFGNRPQTSLKNLLKIYRSNNQKIKNIYETSKITGRQQEYVDFLVDMNKKITESFKKSLPEDSAWLKKFEQTNAEYRNFQNARKVVSQLKGLLSETPTRSEIERLAENKKVQDKLALSMGEEGSKEVIQIAKDLKTATQSLKKIPKTELTKFDAVFPLYFLIPWVGKAFGAVKAIKAARYGYGWFLSTPSTRIAFEDALKALSNQDLNAYKKATTLLSKELERKQKD